MTRFVWLLTFGRILNVRKEIRRFDRKFQLPPKFSNDPFFWLWTFGRKFERSTGNSNYHRNFPMTCFFFSTINVWPGARARPQHINAHISKVLVGLPITIPAGHCKNSMDSKIEESQTTRHMQYLLGIQEKHAFPVERSKSGKTLKFKKTGLPKMRW